MPRSRAAHLPLEILIKGSVSDLIKETCSITTLPDPVLDSASDEQSLLDDHKKDEIFNKDLEPQNDKFEPTIKDKHTSNNISKQEVENFAQHHKNNNFLGLLNEFELLYFRRISVRTQQSVYIDGILAEVGRDFIIMITPQLSVVTIPLSGIVSFNILNP